ncbi:hypothetical protein L0244_25475 [bacterium]|nr:hypothetical protein [bacterium]
MMQKLKTVFVILLLVHGFLFCFSGILSAQVFTFDYLTYSDYAFPSHSEFFKGKLTSFLFFGENAFDGSGNASSKNVSYREVYLYGTPRIYTRERVQIAVAFQIGLLLSETTTGRMWGTPWLWGKFKISKSLPLALRLGFEWGKFGNAFWIEDNDFDLGLLVNQNLRSIIINASLSYRIRGKSDLVVTDTGFQNHAGNEIHYKIETLKKLSPKTFLSLLVFGYQSGNKKFNDAVIPDSYSRKTTVGAAFTFHTNSSRSYALSLLLDAAGRYDRKGITFVFNVTD